MQDWTGYRNACGRFGAGHRLLRPDLEKSEGEKVVKKESQTEKEITQTWVCSHTARVHGDILVHSARIEYLRLLRLC